MNLTCKYKCTNGTEKFMDFDFWLCVQLIYFSIISDLSSVGVSITVQREKGTDPVAETSCFQFYFKHCQYSKSKNK